MLAANYSGLSNWCKYNKQESAVGSVLVGLA